jgi:hypothetical protein
MNPIKKRAMRTISYLILLVLFSFSSCSPKKEVETCDIETCCAFLKKHGQSPKDYVISKFEQYDYVFLGEYHRNKQDVDFVISLIPDLYKNGIRNIAYEFYEYEFQQIIDSLLTAKEWDEKMLYHNVSKTNVTWGYFEYLDLFKKIWEFNQTLSPNQDKFRLVMLGYDYNPCKDNPFEDFDPDAFLADVFKKEITSKKEKALVYCGIHHAFTKYKQPVYDFERGKLIRLDNKRMGNIIHKKFPKKTFTIKLHSPWTSNKGWNEQCVRPVNGVIDSVMSMLGNIPMGFDAKSTIMGNLRATDTYYAFGYEDFKLSDFCDGYIFLLPYKEVEFVSVEPNFYDDYNLNKLKEFMKCRGFSDEQIQMITKETAIEMLTEKPEIHYGDLMK